MDQIFTPIKTGSSLQAFFAAAEIFLGGKKFFPFSEKNKIRRLQELPERITLLPAGRVLAAGILAGVIFVFPARADNEFKPAEQILCPVRSSAEAGSLVDEYYLALAYDKGYCGITADKKSARAWYLKAAEHGHMLAQYRMGEIYFTGEDGIPDYPQAKRWYLEAAQQGHGLSQLRLAFLYAEAHFSGLTTDYKEAERWFLQAAMQNAGDAQFRLGNFYHNYKNPPDMVKAIYWLTRAAEGGHRVAMFDLARLLKDKPEESLMWMKKAADLDVISAQMTLSEMYATGDRVPKDPVQSFIWTLKIASAPAAPLFWINKAADICFEGWETIVQNYPKARELYKRAADKGDPHALARLGQMYLEGLGGTPDPEKAREYLNKAAAKGSTEAQSLLDKKIQP